MAINKAIKGGTLIFYTFSLYLSPGNMNVGLHISR